MCEEFVAEPCHFDGGVQNLSFKNKIQPLFQQILRLDLVRLLNCSDIIQNIKKIDLFQKWLLDYCYMHL